MFPKIKCRLARVNALEPVWVGCVTWGRVAYLGYILLWVYHCNSNLMENLFRCNFVHDFQIATKFCTCHDSTAVVSCAKFCSRYFIKLWVRAKVFHWIWNMIEESLVKWAASPSDVIYMVIDCLTWLQFYVHEKNMHVDMWVDLNNTVLFVISISLLYTNTRTSYVDRNIIQCLSFSLGRKAYIDLHSIASIELSRWSTEV